MDESRARTSDARDRMVAAQLRGRDITDTRVLAAMAAVPREAFVRASDRGHAYEDHPLSIGAGQTISQPYIVARMTELLAVGPGDCVLDVGTGSGYQAAILAELGCRVTSIDREPRLATEASERLARLGYADRVTVTRATAAWDSRTTPRGTGSSSRLQHRASRMRSGTSWVTDGASSSPWAPGGSSCCSSWSATAVSGRSARTGRACSCR